jgi:Kef-type K+ transport system membrane component KefB
MKKLQNLLYYVVVTFGLTAVMFWIASKGKLLETFTVPATAGSDFGAFSLFGKSITDNLHHPLALLLVQIVIIIFVARLLGWVFKKIGQPSVIGEIIAGIMLGPSLLGMYFPEFSKFLFPSESLGNLQVLSQIGLILFMFMVGMELDLKVLKSKANEAIIISHASIIIPFALGMGLAYYIYQLFAPEGVKFLSFGLFIGISMSITAFPVLARIVQERGMHKTKLGAIVITCAAADDITAWCLLAAVIAIVKAGSFVSSLYTILLAVGYVLVMIKLVCPFLARVADLYPSRENMSKQVVAIFFLMLILSAYTTEIIGIHALFGAFMAGTIMPDKVKFRSIFIEKVEDVALVLLLPLFFVYTGLRTEIGLINDPELWEITGLIILVAVTGKFVGGALTAKFVGQNWHDSLSIGALMNTRGLMELVVLNIGYDLGILKPEIFAMMVIMALVTTFMTGPALHLIEKLFKKDNSVFHQIREISKYKIMVSFANPHKGRVLLRLANALVKKNSSNSMVTAVHLSPNREVTQINIDEYEAETFAPIIEESKELNLKITTLFKVSGNIYSDISEYANKGDFDLLLVGIGQSIYEGSLLGRILGFTTRIIDPDTYVNTVTGKEKLFERSVFEDSTRQILMKTRVPVGIFIDKGLNDLATAFIPLMGNSDEFLIGFAQKLINNAQTQVTICDFDGITSANPTLKESIRAIEHNAPNHISLITSLEIDQVPIDQTDLIILSLDGWKKAIELKPHWILKAPSTLIIRE